MSIPVPSSRIYIGICGMRYVHHPVHINASNNINIIVRSERRRAD